MDEPWNLHEHARAVVVVQAAQALGQAFWMRDVLREVLEVRVYDAMAYRWRRMHGRLGIAAG